MAGKYDKKLDVILNHYNSDEMSCSFLGDLDAMTMEADAEIVDLREKCDKLAGAVRAVDPKRTESAVNYWFECQFCGAWSKYYVGPFNHAPDCPVQIAREVMKWK